VVALLPFPDSWPSKTTTEERSATEGRRRGNGEGWVWRACWSGPRHGRPPWSSVALRPSVVALLPFPDSWPSKTTTEERSATEGRRRQTGSGFEHRSPPWASVALR